MSTGGPPVGGEPGAPLVLVGMSAHEVAREERLTRLAAPHGARVAHLQLGDPALHRVLDQVAAAGATTVRLVGVSTSRLAPGASWLRRVAGAWWRGRVSPPEVLVADRLVADAGGLAEALRAGLRPLTGREAGLASPAWDDAPQHRRHVLLCRGPRCTAAGADATHEALVREMVRRGLGDDDVLVTVTGCLTPCNHGPVVCLQPDDTWLGAVGPEEARVLVGDLRGGIRGTRPAPAGPGRRPRPGRVVPPPR